MKFFFLHFYKYIWVRVRSHTLLHTIYDFCQQRNFAPLWMCLHNSLSIGNRFAKRMKQMKSWKFTRNVIFISHTLHATHTQNGSNTNFRIFFRFRSSENFPFILILLLCSEQCAHNHFSSHFNSNWNRRKWVRLFVSKIVQYDDYVNYMFAKVFMTRERNVFWLSEK